ncbi:helix-turn-helix domain-containing protein [Rhodococcus opacus]|uniref:helix-turn-helix domain-containing protein n=1 Tax=Rhodococcus opacus TaxID=37919 RepID=UPI001C453D45|nr:XRE family transcriptional regulator [Rhodococcus opacus]MBV6762326.1 XRE family transcriptional regulator [Rhodococcus opacus]
MDSPETAAAAGEQSAGPRLRAFRLAKGMSLAAVAAEAGITKGFLSLAERGKTRVSVPTLLRICDVLDVQLGSLFDYPSGTIVHGGAPLDMGGNDIDEFMLTPSDEEHLQVMRSVIQPGGGSDGTYTLEAESIFALVLSGSMDLTVDGVMRSLGAGDSTTFSARSEHGFVNPGQTVTEVVWSVVPPLPHGDMRRVGRSKSKR